MKKKKHVRFTKQKILKTTDKYAKLKTQCKKEDEANDI